MKNDLSIFIFPSSGITGQRLLRLLKPISKQIEVFDDITKMKSALKKQKEFPLLAIIDFTGRVDLIEEVRRCFQEFPPQIGTIAIADLLLIQTTKPAFPIKSFGVCLSDSDKQVFLDSVDAVVSQNLFIDPRLKLRAKDHNLTPLEYEILTRIEKDPTEISGELDIGTVIVEKHIDSILEKLNLITVHGIKSKRYQLKLPMP